MLVVAQAKTYNSAYNERRLDARLKALLYSVAIIFGAIQAWGGRYEISPDGISYLDIADAYLRGDWAIAFNAQWSPLYCWLLIPVLLVVKHSPAWEFPAVHILNFAIYLFSLVCFDFLMRRLSRYRREFEDGRLDNSHDNSQAGLPEWAWITLGYALFMWASFEMINIAYVQPDLLVAASVYLATGILLGMRMGQAGWRAFIALGAVLGFGYLAKAPMFLLAFVFLALSLWAAGNTRKALPRAAVALVVFLSIAGPFIFAISEVKGRPTFGDSGKLNYAWYVNDVTRFIHWQEGDIAYGTPAHTTRKIFDSPAVYEFARPIESTYPPWYDPSYWYEGVKPRFDLAGQLKVLRWSAGVWWHLLFNMQKGMIVLILILLCMTGRSALRRRNLIVSSYLFVPALAAFGMFSLVNLEARYIAPFFVLACMGMLSLVRLPD